jgi:hypothetical protein
MNIKAQKDCGQGKICKIEPICEHEEDEIYIGSTCKMYLSPKLGKHKIEYKHWKLGKRTYTTSYKLFDKYRINNCQIALLESVTANNINELQSREAHYIKAMKCVNKYVPLRTDASSV